MSACETDPEGRQDADAHSDADADGDRDGDTFDAAPTDADESTADGDEIDVGPADADVDDGGEPTGVQPMPIEPFPTGAQTVYTPFVGVRVVHRTTDEPRPLSYQVVLIDPDEPGLDFLLTPANGDDPRETTRQTTTAFLEQSGAQLGINVHFFTPWPPEDDYANLSGLAVSQGDAFSPFSDTYDVGIAIQPDNTPALVGPADPDNPSLEMTPSVPVDEAVGAREQIITDGVNTASWPELHPRTVMGIATNGEIVIGVVDGRQDGRSEGMGTGEVADILIADFNVVDAINLDGGGSTTLAIADPEPRLLNVAMGSGPLAERAVGSNLAIFAQPPPPLDTAPDLVAHEPFDQGHRPWGVDGDAMPLAGGLSNLGGGTGWASSWLDDFTRSRFFGVALYPTDETAGRPNPLGYADGSGLLLQTTGGQARGCYGSDCATTRPIDTNRVDPGWLTTNREIGADGAEVWVSFLAQSETGDGGDRWAHVELGEVLRLGRIADGDGLWGLQDARTGSQTMSTISAANAVFFVARIQFLAGDDHVEAWLNPPLDAVPLPAEPTLSMSLPSFSFRTLSLSCRYSTDFDEIRLGQTFAAVAPYL